MLRYVFLSLYAERHMHCLRDMYLVFCCQVLQRTSKKFVEVVVVVVLLLSQVPLFHSHLGKQP